MPYYGPGMPWYGRGAGHICAAERELARIREDLESGLTSRTSFVSDYKTTRETPYIGRGGVGNYGSPEKLMRDPADEAPDTPIARSRRDSQPQTSTYGRGGVGNYAMGAVEGKQNASRKAIEDGQKREQLQADVEKGVEEQLAMPQRAKLNAGRTSIH